MKIILELMVNNVLILDSTIVTNELNIQSGSTLNQLFNECFLESSAVKKDFVRMPIHVLENTIAVRSSFRTFSLLLNNMIGVKPITVHSNYSTLNGIHFDFEGNGSKALNCELALKHGFYDDRNHYLINWGGGESKQVFCNGITGTYAILDGELQLLSDHQTCFIQNPKQGIGFTYPVECGVAQITFEDCVKTLGGLNVQRIHELFIELLNEKI